MSLTETTQTSQLDVHGSMVTVHDSTTTIDGGRPLVLVHGTGGTTASHFGHLFPMMATRTRVIGVDWAPPAEGTELTLDLLVAQVREAVDTVLGPDTPFDLLGYSLGSVVAEALAARLGSRVQHLILVAGWITTDLQQGLRNQVWHSLYENDRDALSRYTAFCGFSGQFLQQFTPEMLEGALTTLTADEFLRQQMALNAEIDLSDEIERITARTLIVSCSDDIMVPGHHQRQLLGAIEDARLTTVSSGHAIFFERQSELMQITDLFLREPDRFAAGSIIPETRS
ncbi:alpha/beta hydrolase [Leucobacter sp. UCMA 4100]|uniref:alpha/beta fold hydrolase n=1 Tax=Leucobacter sp. UCMA 4100 TaxID=2810534 RepID=UPI0022EAAC8E|nr:alpha/beta hydrolase [Leucobacter sp. UCMA 4100]MDA3146887.1 alpha/beta hydrolase [Leucobacter sp. UCMA 4100]